MAGRRTLPEKLLREGLSTLRGLKCCKPRDQKARVVSNRSPNYRDPLRSAPTMTEAL
jgi:hypothetical protein